MTDIQAPGLQAPPRPIAATSGWTDVATLFSESASRVVVSVAEDRLDELVALARADGEAEVLERGGLAAGRIMEGDILEGEGAGPAGGQRDRVLDRLRRSALTAGQARTRAGYIVQVGQAEAGAMHLAIGPALQIGDGEPLEEGVRIDDPLARRSPRG